jgi:F-type H+-transporting ATPase subunit b
MISINATLVVQIINLLVLIFIMNKLLYKPIQEIMMKRHLQVADGHHLVQEINQKVAHGREDYQSQIREGRHEVRARLAKLKAETEAEALVIINAAQEDALKRTEEITRNISDEIGSARQEIPKEAQGVALSLASNILGREVS